MKREYQEDNNEEMKFNWGVTDKEHIVTAEGFSINELDERIKQ